MTGWGRPARRLAGVDPAAIPFDDLFAVQEPVVLEGAAAHWPVVQAGLESAEAAA